MGAVTEQLGDPEGEVHALAAVEAGVAHGLIAAAEVGSDYFGTTTQTLGHVVTGEFQVYATGMGVGEAVGGEEAGDFC